MIIKAHYNESLIQQKELLEAIRLQTFHLAQLKPGINYKLFCNKYFPFTWDKQDKKEKPAQKFDLENSKKIISTFEQLINSDQKKAAIKSDRITSVIGER